MSRFISRKILLQVGIFLLFVVFCYQLIPKKSISDRIADGSLQYTKELGWINWGHAQKEATQQAYNLLIKRNRKCDTSFEYEYAQKMFYKVGPIGIRVSQSAKYSIQKIKNVQNLQKIFLKIFEQTSTSFEKMQDAFPYNLFKSISSSSFRDGDLTGNILSYYAVIKDVPLEDLKQQFKHNTKAKSLEEFEQNGIRQANWSDAEKSIKGYKLLGESYKSSPIKEADLKLIQEKLHYSFE